jgi:hypothetical protein
MTPYSRHPWVHLVLAFLAITGAMQGVAQPGRGVLDLVWSVVAASGAYNAVLFGVAWERRGQDPLPSAADAPPGPLTRPALRA